MQIGGSTRRAITLELSGAWTCALVGGCTKPTPTFCNTNLFCPFTVSDITVGNAFFSTLRAHFQWTAVKPPGKIFKKFLRIWKAHVVKNLFHPKYLENRIIFFLAVCAHIYDRIFDRIFSFFL